MQEVIQKALAKCKLTHPLPSEDFHVARHQSSHTKSGKISEGIICLFRAGRETWGSVCLFLRSIILFSDVEGYLQRTSTITYVDQLCSVDWSSLLLLFPALRTPDSVVLAT